MKRYYVYVNVIQNGLVEKTCKVACDIRGNNLDEQTILKRLSNNIQTWQSAYNKGYINKCKFEIVNYEEAK